MSLSVDAGACGVCVNAVYPGPTETGWMSDDLRESLASQSPFGRVGLPSDAADLCVFLASDEAAWVTGQAIRSRGGL